MLVDKANKANKAIQVLTAEAADLADRRAAHNENWQRLWRSTGLAPGAPADMANWLDALATLIGDCQALDADTAKLDALAIRWEALKAVVEALGTELGVSIHSLRRLRIFGQRDKLKADRSKGA